MGLYGVVGVLLSEFFITHFATMVATFKLMINQLLARCVQYRKNSSSLNSVAHLWHMCFSYLSANVCHIPDFVAHQTSILCQNDTRNLNGVPDWHI
jgi:hypothetical protein